MLRGFILFSNEKMGHNGLSLEEFLTHFPAAEEAGPMNYSLWQPFWPVTPITGDTLNLTRLRRFKFKVMRPITACQFVIM